MTANTANVGIVCNTPAIVSTILDVLFIFDNKIPNGTAMTIAINKAMIEI